MKHLLLSICVAALVATAPSNAENSNMGDAVLISSTDTRINGLSDKEVRLLYLGIPVIKTDTRVEAIIN